MPFRSCCLSDQRDLQSNCRIPFRQTTEHPTEYLTVLFIFRVKKFLKSLDSFPFWGNKYELLVLHFFNRQDRSTKFYLTAYDKLLGLKFEVCLSCKL